MTRQRHRMSAHSGLVNRRPGRYPGRRFAFRALLALTLLALPASALADQTVLRATIYSAAGVTHPSVGLSALEGCPTYSGPNQLLVYPGGSDYTVPSSSAWALATVLSCGLGLPVSGVTDVWVQRSSGGFEAPLTNPDLVVPSPFQDPSAQPLVANDGGAVQNTYFRPWRGGSDENATDEVTANGPIAIVVADSGQLLEVTVSQRTVARRSSLTTVRFGATVRSPNGGVVSSGSLLWDWSFGDSSSSTARSPTHLFQDGVYPVTVLVSAEGTGEVGTATIDVDIGGGSAHAPSSRGSGGRHSKSHAPTGPKNSEGSHPGGPAGQRSAGSSGGTHSPRPGSSERTSNPGAATHHAEATRARGRRVATRALPSTPRSSPIKPGIPVERRAPVVSGLLIGEVTPIPPDQIPFVDEASGSRASAPAVRSGGGVSPIAGVAGGVCLAALFAYGAARELRGQRGGTVRGPLT